MKDFKTYSIRESFPVGETGVALRQVRTDRTEYRTYLYPSEDIHTFLDEKAFSSKQEAEDDYFRRCDQLIARYEQKTGKSFPLPNYCASVLKSTGDLVFLRRGMTGYYPAPYTKRGDRAGNEALAKQINDQFGYTKAQIAAMEAGSMFGWNVPGADPSRYDEQGHYMPEPEKTEINDMEKGEER